jgi:BON domain
MKYFLVRTIAVLAICGSLRIAQADDQSIARTLANELKQAQTTSALNDFKIGVRVENGVVWMTGKVSSPGQQDEALAIARAVDGVKLVVNDLTVGDISQAEGQATANSSPRALSAARRQELEGMVSNTQVASPSEVAGQAQAVGFYTDSGMPNGNRQATNRMAQNFLPNEESGQIDFGPPPMSRPAALRNDYAPEFRDARGVTPVSAMRTSSPRTVRPMPMKPGNSRIRPVQHCGPRGCGDGGTPMGDMGGVVSDGAYVDDGYAGNFSNGGPVPEMGSSYGAMGGGVAYENPSMPGYAWPSYAAHPNYAAVTYPKQYSPMAWPYIGPFYPYPQVPLGWRKVTLEWDDGWWMLDFNSK